MDGKRVTTHAVEYENEQNKLETIGGAKDLRSNAKDLSSPILENIEMSTMKSVILLQIRLELFEVVAQTGNRYSLKMVYVFQASSCLQF